MNLNDFTKAMNCCGTGVDHTWKEEDKRGVNPLNSMATHPKFIIEEVKKSIPVASRSSVVICMHPKVSYKNYGKVSSFRRGGFVLPQPRLVKPPKPFTPDIVVNTGSTISFIEMKKITNQTRIAKKNVTTYRSIFAKSGGNFPLTSSTYGNSGSAIFISPSNGSIMTFFHEGQIFNDVARLLNFRKSNEKLFFGAFIFSPTSLKITKNDIENRLDTILNAFNQGFNEVFSEGYGYLNSWALPVGKPPSFTKATTNSFNNGVRSYGYKSGHEIFGIAFEVTP